MLRKEKIIPYKRARRLGLSLNFLLSTDELIQKRRITSRDNRSSAYFQQFFTCSKSSAWWFSKRWCGSQVGMIFVCFQMVFKFFFVGLVVHKIQTKIEVLLAPKKLVFHKSYFAHEVKCAASKACLIEVIFVLLMFGRGSS